MGGHNPQCLKVSQSEASLFTLFSGDIFVRRQTLFGLSPFLKEWECHLASKIIVHPAYGVPPSGTRKQDQ